MKMPPITGASAGNAEHSIAVSPTTLPELEARHAAVLAENRIRTLERARLLPLLPDPQAVTTLVKLDAEATVGHFKAAYWSASVGLARLRVTP